MRLARKGLATLMLLSLLLGLLSALRLGFSLGEPFPGFVLLWRKEYKLLTVSWTTPPNWSGPDAGMRINDRILCINGYMPRPDTPVYGLDPRYAKYPCPNGGRLFADVYRAAYQSSNPAVDIFIDRDGVLQTIPNVPLEPFSFGLLLETFAPSFVLGLALLGLGWVVYRANPEIEINLIFALIMLLVSNFAFNIALAEVVTDRQFETRLVTLAQIIPWVPFFGPLLFHLSDLLFDHRLLPAAARVIRRPFYFAAGVFSIIGVLAYLVIDILTSQYLNLAYLYWVGFSVTFSVMWSLVSLGLAARRSTQRQVRMQAGFVLVALALTVLTAIPFVGLFVANQLTFPYMQGIPYIGLVVVALIAYAILRYQLFATRTRTLTFLLVLVTSVLVALVIYLPVGSDIGFLPLLSVSLLAGMVFIGRFKPFNFLDLLLHHEELDYQVVTRFSQQLFQSQAVEKLVTAACDALKKELEAEQIDLWLLDPHLSRLNHYNEKSLVENLPLDPALLPLLRQTPRPVYVYTDAGQAILRYSPAVAQVHPQGLLAPMNNQDQSIGFMSISPRWTGEVFNEEDVRLVGLLSGQLCLAISNTQQVERLQNMQRRIMQAEENERYKIARELHDTVLQFLLVLTFGLDSLKEDPARLNERVENWQVQISSQAGDLRNLLGYLRTPEALGRRGLLASLDVLFANMCTQTTVKLEWDLDTQVETALSSDSKVAVYRILREAVQNALKHARAHQVSIRVLKQGERVNFSVRDDGLGFDVQSVLNSIDKGYNSLQDMRIYIESTGGQLEIHSAPGQGTTIEGWTHSQPVVTS